MKKGLAIMLAVVLLVGIGAGVLCAQGKTALRRAEELVAAQAFDEARRAYAQPDGAQAAGMRVLRLLGLLKAEPAELLASVDYAEAEYCLAQGYISSAVRLFTAAGDYADAPQALAYAQGRRALETGDDASAEGYLREAGGYADAASLLADCIERRAAKEDEPESVEETVPRESLGDVLTLGSWGEEGQLLRWRVLETRGSDALLLCEDVVDCAAYNSDFRIVEWSNSTLRAWLNDWFWFKAFTAEEQSVIVGEPVDPASLSRFDQASLSRATDKVTLLSASRYGALCAEAAWASPAQTDAWWLMTDGYESDEAAAVTPEGALAYRQVNEALGIRPVIWVDLGAYAKAFPEGE